MAAAYTPFSECDIHIGLYEEGAQSVVWWRYQRTFLYRKVIRFSDGFALIHGYNVNFRLYLPLLQIVLENRFVFSWLVLGVKAEPYFISFS